MSRYLEIPRLAREFPFRRFVHKGEVLAYPHWHKMVEIIYVTRGVLHLGVNDIPIVMQAGEIQFINAGDTHYFLASPNSERIVVQFDFFLFHDDEALQNDGQPGLRHRLSTMCTHSRQWPLATTLAMQNLLQAVSREDEERSVGYKYMIKARLLEIIALIYRDIPVNQRITPRPLDATVAFKSEKTLARLDKIFSYIEHHYHESLTLDDISGYMGFNTCYFTRFFRNNTGTTFIRFLHNYRLNRAKWLLLNEEISVSEVAERVGFNSVKTFHHVFKQDTGIAPRQYKKSISGIK